MTTTLIAVITLAQGQATPATACPVMGGVANDTQPKVTYSGNVFGFCCAGCIEPFEADPASFIKKYEGDTPLAYSAYDPISRKMIDAKKPVFTSEFEHIVYRFSSEENKAAFDKNPKKLSKSPTMEVFGTCAVRGVELKPGKEHGYADYKDVRYYFCCAGCFNGFAKDPAEHAKKHTPAKAVVHRL